MIENTDFEVECQGSSNDWEVEPASMKEVGIASDRQAIILLTLVAAAFVAGIVLLVSSSISFSQVFNPGRQVSDEENGQKSEGVTHQGLEPADTLLKGLSTAGDCQVSAGYPNKVRRWCGIITAYSDKRGLPPDLVAAVILQESGGNPSAYSHSGAVGLMQVMPSDGPASTFMCANGPCFASRPRQDELLDPEFNIAYGTRMLSGLVRRHGSLREALKSYGPMDGGYYYADKVLGIYEKFGS